MAAEVDAPETVPTVLVGLLSGLLAGLAMGVILHVGAGAMPFIGSLYGEPTVAAGWMAHLVNSIVLGVVFAFLVRRPTLVDRVEGPAEFVIAGVAYATVVGLFTAAVLVPIAVGTLGIGELPQPIAEPAGLGALLLALSVGAAHVVYGAVLGFTYERIQMERVPATEPRGEGESIGGSNR